MGFRKDHFGEGFAYYRMAASIFNSVLARDGTTATWWRRTRGTQDATTGYEAITWDSTKTLKILFEPISSSNAETPGGVVDEQRLTIFSVVEVPQFDRLVFGGETYEIENEPRPFFYRGQIAHYSHTGIKRT